MKGLGAAAVAVLAVWTLLAPAIGAWAFALLELVFLAWLARALRKAAAPPAPELLRESTSALAATGLASLVLVPWLTYKLQWAQAILIGVMLVAVGALTRRAVRRSSVEQPERRREAGRDE